MGAFHSGYLNFFENKKKNKGKKVLIPQRGVAS